MSTHRFARRTALASAVLAALLAGTACMEQAQQAASTATTEAQQTLDTAVAEGGVIDQAMDEAARKLREENIDLHRAEGLPSAAITPQGDLLVDGKPMPLTDAQREAVLAYRGELIAVADAGMAIGKDGMRLAGDAMSMVVAGLFNGDADAASARLEAEAKKMESAGAAICERVKGLEAAQARVAELVPAFRPYAVAMDVEADCDPPTDASAGTPAPPPAP